MSPVGLVVDGLWCPANSVPPSDPGIIGVDLVGGRSIVQLFLCIEVLLDFQLLDALGELGDVGPDALDLRGVAVHLQVNNETLHCFTQPLADVESGHGNHPFS